MLFDSFLSPIAWWDWKLNPALRSSQTRGTKESDPSCEMS